MRRICLNHQEFRAVQPIEMGDWLMEGKKFLLQTEGEKASFNIDRHRIRRTATTDPWRS